MMGPMLVNASSESLQDVYMHMESPPISSSVELTREFRIVFRGLTMAFVSFVRRLVNCPVGIPSKKAIS